MDLQRMSIREVTGTSPRLLESPRRATNKSNAGDKRPWKFRTVSMIHNSSCVWPFRSLSLYLNQPPLVPLAEEDVITIRIPSWLLGSMGWLTLTLRTWDWIKVVRAHLGVVAWAIHCGQVQWQLWSWVIDHMFLECESGSWIMDGTKEEVEEYTKSRTFCLRREFRTSSLQDIRINLWIFYGTFYFAICFEIDRMSSAWAFNMSEFLWTKELVLSETLRSSLAATSWLLVIFSCKTVIDLYYFISLMWSKILGYILQL